MVCVHYVCGMCVDCVVYVWDMCWFSVGRVWAPWLRRGPFVGSVRFCVWLACAVCVHGPCGICGCDIVVVCVRYVCGECGQRALWVLCVCVCWWW